MQPPQTNSVTLNDILITEKLSRRSPRTPNWKAEAQAMGTLARQLTNAPELMLQNLADIALELCHAGAAGVSLLETNAKGEQVFRWNVLAGTLEQYVGGTTPRNFSPCGVCLDRGTPVLFSHPERYFTYFQAVNKPIVEGLVLPIIADNHALGTVWIMSHDEGRQFDSEDVRVMTSLADFMAAVLLLNQQQTQELRAKNTQLEAEIVDRKRTEAALRESEERLRAVIENLPGGAVFVVDRNLRYLMAEGKALAIAGFKPEDLVGQTIFEVLAPELIPNYEMLYRQALAGESFEHEHYSHDRWYISRGTPLRAEDGEIYGVLAVSYNISERKRTEEAMRESEEHQAFLLKFSDTLRAEPDADAIANRAIRMLSEHMQLDRSYIVSYRLEDDRADLVHQVGNDTVPPFPDELTLSDYPAALRATFDQTLVIDDVAETKGLTDLDRRNIGALGLRALVAATLRKGENRPLWAIVAISSHPRRWTRGEVALAEEVTERTWVAMERARAEAELRASEIQRVREQSAREQERQRAESLAELDRAKTLFFSNVSHEFRTPLTLSLAPLQDALSDVAHPLDPVHRERLKLAQRNATRLLKLVNTLLDFSRIEAGRVEAVYEPTDLARFTAELASSFRSAMERAGLRLLVDCPPLPEPVYVDREMWEKIVLNLLSNAYKFTFAGEISLSLYPTDNDRLILQIQDTGIGIAPEHLPHLFERFYQVREAKGRTHEGTGIGLALTQELIRLHGGTIEVSSTLGQGTCFAIALRFGTDHLPSDRVAFSQENRLQNESDRQPPRTLASTTMGAAAYVKEAEQWLPKKAEGQEVSPTFSNARILLVDDNTDMREYLTRILSEHVEVEAVADGASALAAAQAQVPDLILSDIMMPGLDGFELLQALRADPRTREVPILLLSARAGEEAIVEGLQAGADDYLIKPFSAAELVSRVNAHLQMAQLRGEALQHERAMSRKKDEWLSIVTHELNAPLVAILGWTRLLRENPSSQSMLSKALETIERNATVQANLVQDLLDISRIIAGKLRLQLQPVQLKPIVENAIASVTPAAVAKNLDLQFKVVQPTKSFQVMADRDRLGQVIFNLLTNAVKFTPEGGRVEVILSWGEAGQSTNYAQIAVTDTGIGIPADFLPQIFDHFCQVESGASGGLGLGLAIARHLVELHQGTIRATSEGEGRGATFIIQLPLLNA